MLDFSTGFGVRIDVERRRGEVDALVNPDRPGVSPKE
jgi:hypothetical protein